MVSRSRFFRASLWAALAPVAILVAAIIVVMFLPRLYKPGDNFLLSSGVMLFGVPFAYTAVVVATYCIGRGLHSLRVLNLVTLFVLYGVSAAALAWLATWWIATSETVNVARSFAIFLVLGLIAAVGTAFIWWRVVTRAVPGAQLDDELRVRVRRRQKKGFFRRLASKW